MHGHAEPPCTLPFSNTDWGEWQQSRLHVAVRHKRLKPEAGSDVSVQLERRKKALALLANASVA